MNRFVRPIFREWYFDSGKRLVDYYEAREKILQRYKSLTDESREFSDDEIERIENEKMWVDEVEALLSEYRDFKKEVIGDDNNIPVQYQAELDMLRDEVLDAIDRTY